jgi:iron complex transport system substrate-binding protein
MVLMPCGLDLEHTLELAPTIARRPGFDGLPCAASGRVVAVDGSAYFNRPGPRITHGLSIMAAAVRAARDDVAPAGGAYWNQPATSRMALMTPRPL